MLSINKVRHNHATANGVDIHFRSAGSPDAPALVFLHGTPSSSHMYRNVLSPLAEAAYVIAPDMPAFGFSAMPRKEDYDYTFENISRTLGALLDDLGLRSYYLYMHDWGVAVGYYLATRAPDRIRGLIVQNASAHDEGLGPGWDTTKAFWADPSEENRARLPEWLNFEGTRETYLGGMPKALESLAAPESWHLDWERMSRPGRIEIEFALFQDFRKHVARFPEIEAYHRRYQPRCLLLWGRHDPYFDLNEVMAYNRVLENVETHIYGSSHFLLETHALECVALIKNFIENAEATPGYASA
jgi:pimeloyl-ACP methyl ester carboxylesterase